MLFLVTAKQECGGFDPWSGHAVIQLGTVAVQQLRAFQRVFKNIRETCTLEELRISGWYARFYSALVLEDLIPTATEGQLLTENGYVRVHISDGFKDRAEAERTELDRLIITAEGFSFCCELKNTDQYVVTACVPYEALK